MLPSSRMRLLDAALAGLLLTAPVVATAWPAAARAEESEAELKKKLKALKKQNAKLKDELAKERADSNKRFDEATRAEKQAGLDFRRATVVASQGVPESAVPVSQPATRHASLRLDEAQLEMSVSFQPARFVRTWRVHNANCEVARKAR